MTTGVTVSAGAPGEARTEVTVPLAGARTASRAACASASAKDAVSEALQATYYRQAITMAYCQPNVVGLLFFHVTDEFNANTWQSGLYYADDTIQHAGIVVGMGGVAGHGHQFFPRAASGHMQRLQYTQNVAAVTGACLLVPRKVFEDIGGFDEGFVLAFNDVDLCLQILAKGYRVVWTPDAELYHLESKTRGPEDTPEKEARFKKEYDLFHAKWGEWLRRGDPYYSRHFRLDRPDFALKAS